MLFRHYKKGNKPVLPASLFEHLIQIKHYSVYGAHASKTRILRDVSSEYYTPPQFSKELEKLTKECFVCQIFQNDTKGHQVKSLPRPSKPRDSWSIDIIPNMPKTENGNTQILLCAEDMTSFVRLIPLKDTSSKSIIEGLKEHIFAPFGVPSTIRSDEQSSFYSSKEFYKFTKQFNIDLTATAVASPFSNSRAESQIKNIKLLTKKFLYQEHCLDKWDEFIQILASTHNRSVGIYGYSAEELMFGTKNSNNNDLLKFDWTNGDEKTFVENIFNICENNRKMANIKMTKKSDENKTYKNINRIIKEFLPGSLVLAKQLQVSTGRGSSFKPTFTGPYTIIHLNNDESTAVIEHMDTKHICKAHFSNLQKFVFQPKRMPLNSNVDMEFLNDIRHH